MRKVMLLLVVLFAFSLTGCTDEEVNELEFALTSMDELDSYRMDITMEDFPMFGNLFITAKLDGDLLSLSSPFADEVSYSKIIDGEEYAYILNDDGELVLSDTPVEYEDGDTDFLDELTYEDFEKVEDEWVLIEDRIYINEIETEYMKDVVIVLDDDGYLDEMTFTLFTEGYSINVILEISGINSTTVTLPE